MGHLNTPKNRQNFLSKIKKVFLDLLRNLPFRVTLVYSIFGFLWILLSDKIISGLANDTKTLTYLQTYKGWFYVIITAILVYRLISDNLWRVTHIKEDLEQSEKKYRNIFEHYRDIYFELDKEGRIIEISPSSFHIYGYSREDLLSKDFTDFIVGEDNKINLYNFIFNNKVRDDIELKIIHKNGSIHYCSVNTIVINDEVDNYRIIGSIHDITQRKQTELYLRKMSMAVEQSPNITMITDLEGNIEYVNPRFESITGYSSQEILGKNPRTLKTNHFPEEYFKGLWDTILKGNVWQGRLFNKTKMGKEYWESAIISPIKNDKGEITHFVKVANDITELLNKQDQLEFSLKQKETLLQEVFHRTKNNMQLISSMLKLGNRYVKDSELKSVVNNINNRIIAMSLIHDEIYNKQDIDRINVSDYLQSLIVTVSRNHDMLNGDLNIDIKSENIYLNANILITIGLLITELISVSLCKKRNLSNPGNNLIEFYKTANKYHLVYHDSRRCVLELLASKSDSLELKMILALINQLRGEFVLKDHENSIEVSFMQRYSNTFNAVNG